MPTKKQPTPTVVINAKIICTSWYIGEPLAFYIDIVHGGQTFKGDKPYRFHANAERFARKMGFNVVPDGLDDLMGK